MKGIRARSISSCRCAARAASHQGTPNRPTAPRPRITTGVPIRKPTMRPRPNAPRRIVSQTCRLQPRPDATYRSRSTRGSISSLALRSMPRGVNPLTASTTTRPSAISTRTATKNRSGLMSKWGQAPPSGTPPPVRDAGGACGASLRLRAPRRHATGAETHSLGRSPLLRPLPVPFSYRGHLRQVVAQLVRQLRRQVAEQRDLPDQPAVRRGPVHPAPVADPVAHGDDAGQPARAADLAQVDRDVERLVHAALRHVL